MHWNFQIVFDCGWSRCKWIHIEKVWPTFRSSAAVSCKISLKTCLVFNAEIYVCRTYLLIHEQKLLFLLMCIRFGKCKVLRLNRAYGFFFVQWFTRNLPIDVIWAFCSQRKIHIQNLWIMLAKHQQNQPRDTVSLSCYSTNAVNDVFTC